MKKTYIKPEVYFEDFELSANIAAGCGKIVPHAEGQCRFDVTGMGTVFTSNLECGYPPEEAGLCYHNPDGDAKLFGS